MPRGIQEWVSSAGFHVIRLHYTADPDKDPSTPKGKIWLDNEIKGIPGGMKSAQFQREYEINWEATGGELVFPQFGAFQDKIIVTPFDVPETWNLFASFDYGHRNPSAFHVFAIDYDQNIYVIWEYYKSGEGYRNIAKSIWNCPYYRRLVCAPIADPSIWAMTQNTESEVKSLAMLFAEIEEGKDTDDVPIGPIMFTPGKKGGDLTVAEKINAHFWANLHEQDAKLKLFATCPMAAWELQKLRYAEWSGTLAMQRNKREALVDRDNHYWDAMKMFITQFFMGPDKLPVPAAYEKLKDVDEISYNEAKFRASLAHGKETTTLAEF